VESEISKIYTEPLLSVQVDSMLKTEAAFSPKKFALTYQITRSHIDIYQTEVKRSQCEANYLPVSSVDVINFYIFISTAQIRLHGTAHRHTYNFVTTFPDEKHFLNKGNKLS
jgi:hypothetical protein